MLRFGAGSNSRLKNIVPGIMSLDAPTLTGLPIFAPH